MKSGKRTEKSWSESGGYQKDQVSRIRPVGSGPNEWQNKGFPIGPKRTSVDVFCRQICLNNYLKTLDDSV